MKSPSNSFLQSNSLRSFLVFAFDLCAVVLCWHLALWLRFNLDIPTSYAKSSLTALLWVVPVHAVMFRLFGLYKGIWVFASLPDLLRIIRAIAVSICVVMVCSFLIRLSPPVPRSVYLFFPILLLMAMGGARAAYRAHKEHLLYGGLIAKGKPVLLLGAGVAGMNAVRDLARTPQWRVVGALDDNPHKIGRELLSVSIVGAIKDVAYWSQKLKVKHAIVAIPSASASQRAHVLSLCVKAGLRTLVIPSLEEMIQQGNATNNMREASLEDLVGREPVKLDLGDIAGLLQGRTVMVTGAGGSIGSELCRQIARFSPSKLVAYELNEFALYKLIEDFREHFPDITLVPVTGDVREAAWLDETFKITAPCVVFHAAAYKHVPLMEESNAWQAVRNNVYGTWQLANAAITHGVEKFVLVSTDKAVNPTNVMGASKRLAEMVCQHLQAQGKTAFSSVRFGNVLGSAGSVVPKFQAQIARGGPVTVTHPDITRYFMSIPEAAQLVLQAAAMGQGGEIFVMDMGEPVRIADLARDMILMSGRTEEEISIEFTGLRPGEKLFEELLSDQEHTLPTSHAKLRIAQARQADANVVAQALAFLQNAHIPSSDQIKTALQTWVPEYVPFQALVHARPTIVVKPRLESSS